MAENFRYLKIVNGYQKGNVFTGFKETGYWEVNPLSPAYMEFRQGETKSIPVNITRVDFSGDIELKAINLPLGVTAQFDPPMLTGGATSSTLKLSATDLSVYDITTTSVVTGLPAPRKVAPFQVKILQATYWEFGTPYEGSPTTTIAPSTTLPPDNAAFLLFFIGKDWSAGENPYFNYTISSDTLIAKDLSENGKGTAGPYSNSISGGIGNLGANSYVWYVGPRAGVPFTFNINGSETTTGRGYSASRTATLSQNSGTNVFIVTLYKSGEMTIT